MKKPNALGLVAIALLLSTSPLAAQKLEVRFYPQEGIHPHELEARRNIQGVLLQNGAIVNRGPLEVNLEGASLEVVSEGRVIATQQFGQADLEKAAKKGAGLTASGMLQIFGFQFRPDLLLGEGVQLSALSKLAPGEALLLGHKFISYTGKADQVRLRFSGHDSAGKSLEVSGELPILTERSKVDYHFPLAGRWFIAAAATPHSHHRWVAAEEFALDIARLGEGLRSSRGEGRKRQDYYAYGAEVLAAADGTVVKVIGGIEETDEYLRQPEESFEAYGERMGQMQETLMMKGIDNIAGNLVVIDHGNGEFSHYAHLKTGSPKVKVGDKVKQGQTIGQLGTSGNSTEPHLHFQITNGSDPLNSAGIPSHFSNIELPWADWERELQTGDVIETR